MSTSKYTLVYFKQTAILSHTASTHRRILLAKNSTSPKHFANLSTSHQKSKPRYLSLKQKKSQLCLTSKQGSIRPTIVPLLDSWHTKSQPRVSLTIHSNLVFRDKQIATHWFALNEFALQCMTSQLLRITQERHCYTSTRSTMQVIP